MQENSGLRHVLGYMIAQDLDFEVLATTAFFAISTVRNASCTDASPEVSSEPADETDDARLAEIMRLLLSPAPPDVTRMSV